MRCCERFREKSPGGFCIAGRTAQELQGVPVRVDGPIHIHPDAYLAAVLPLEEYQRRRLELEQRQPGIAEQARQLGVSVERHDELAGMVQLIETFCQRVQQGIAEPTFEQKRQLIELLLDRVVVPNEKVEIRYAIPTCPTSEQLRFCHLRLDYFNVPPPALLTSPYLIVQTPEDGWMLIAQRAAS